jgi:hypothetical protein
MNTDELKYEDFKLMMSIMNHAAEKGIFHPGDMSPVGNLFEKIRDCVSEEIEAERAAAEAEEALAEGTEESE